MYNVEYNQPGTDVMILKIFSPKFLAKILAFIVQTTASFCENLIITLDFFKTPIFFAENCRKSPKIAIITSAPGMYICTTQQYLPLHDPKF
jgi:hypothetical protein